MYMFKDMNTYVCILYNKQYYNWDILLGYGVEFEYSGWVYVFIICVGYIYIHIYIYYMYISGQVVTTSLFSRTLESWLIREIIPKWPNFSG